MCDTSMVAGNNDLLPYGRNVWQGLCLMNCQINSSWEKVWRVDRFQP